MKSSLFAFLLLTVFFLGGCVENQARLWQQGTDILNAAVAERPLTTDEIGQGLKEALKVGTGNVVIQLGRKDGFNLDPVIHIPLPDKLVKVQTALDKVGLSYLLNDLELKLNRAAELAAPKARALFWQSIYEMTFNDIMSIYNGPDDAATRYFQNRMTPGLIVEMRPVVSASLAQVGAIQAYDRAIGKYRALPFVPDVKADLTSYVIEQGISGIFFYLAREEQAIRRNPANRTTELLQRVFAGR
ncbi:MAG: DUF4197 domain-containing protein [Desulfuromonas sp.]|nr:MAG: DUF4197 domain-containing protein [Desulfuromonas sp.]